MTLDYLARLMDICKERNIAYIEFDKVKIAFNAGLTSEPEATGDNADFEGSAGLFDHLGGKEPEFTLDE